MGTGGYGKYGLLPLTRSGRSSSCSATPFTNTLPIGRLGLEQGESEELTVTYVRVPELLVGPQRQRYGCLEAQADGGLYRLEVLPSGFTAELPVDAEGLVIDYPGLFRRAWSG
jgi:uncharacterized protein